MTLTPGATGQFEVRVNHRSVVRRGGNWLTRRFGAGYPDMEQALEEVKTALTQTQDGRSAPT